MTLRWVAGLIGVGYLIAFFSSTVFFDYAFHFRHVEIVMKWAKYVYFFLLAPSIYLMFFFGVATESMRWRFPTSWVRFIAKIMFSLLLPVVPMLIFVPIPSVSWLLATGPIEKQARVIETEERRTRHCKQSIKIEIDGVSDWICQSRISVTGKMKVGATIAVIGSSSPLGMHVDELKAR